MKRLQILFPILLAAVLAGCTGALPDEYVSVAPHAEQPAVTEDDNALTAENYLSLKNAILSFVQNGVEDGMIRISDYTGDVEEDLASATYEVSKNDPLGAYAVDYMTHECALIVSYYEVHIHITFRRSLEQIQAIRKVAGMTVLPQELYGAMDGYEGEVTMRVSYYSEEDIPGLVEAYYNQNPSKCMELPKVTVNVYPDSGYVRIVEVLFDYDHTPEELASKAEAVATSVRAAKEYVRYRQTETEKLTLLYTYLTERFRYAPDTTATPVFSFLCEGTLTSEGCAKSLQILCNQIGLECYAVSGLLDGKKYDWNILCVDGVYCHADLLRSMSTGSDSLTLYKDNAMTGYSWDTSLYPACN